MLKRRIVFVLLVCVMPLIHSACTQAAHSASWKAKGVDFNKYKSYAWLAPSDSALNTRRDDKLFAGSIQYESNLVLKKKGMVLKAEQPNAVFIFDTQMENHVKYTQAPSLSVGVGYGGPGYYVGGMVPVAGGQITENPYQKGILIIYMFDVQTRQLIWQGSAGGTIDYSTDVEAIIRKGCHDIFFYLPIKHKS